ncbi:hypothetical protein GE09DRAFT_1220641 [Coniochaeta sp. 2T2.1]|nr:hypothetical protein GE09DRAFT_1220641 [Coniochaeta sp. 2T2.1]
MGNLKVIFFQLVTETALLFLDLTTKGLDEILVPRIESACSSHADTSQNSEFSAKEREDRAKVMLLMEALISPGISDLIVEMGYDNDNNTDPKVLYDYIGQLNNPCNVPAKSFCKRLRGRISSLMALRNSSQSVFGIKGSYQGQPEEYLVGTRKSLLGSTDSAGRISALTMYGVKLHC